jgi:hypothetical protein
LARLNIKKRALAVKGKAPFEQEPPAISQGLGKLEPRFQGEKNLRRKITEGTEKLSKGRKQKPI